MNELLDSLILQADKLTTDIEIKKAEKDPYFFLTRFCYTMDEHWQHKGKKTPYNLFPKKQYIQDLCDIFQTEDLISLEKTRQMMASWIFCGLALWDTMFKDGRRSILMSKKEKDANALVERCKIMYSRLPEQMRNKYPRDPEKYLEMKWSKQGSIIQGLAQGPDQVRSYTSSLVLLDESAFQDKAEKVFEAIQPSIQGGGKFISISTANGRNWFWRTCYDVV